MNEQTAVSKPKNTKLQSSASYENAKLLENLNILISKQFEKYEGKLMIRILWKENDFYYLRCNWVKDRQISGCSITEPYFAHSEFVVVKKVLDGYIVM